MAKKVLPVLSICSLRENSLSPEDFIADRLSHYLKVHELHFPHKHDFYHLVYFSSGSGVHSIDFINHKVKPGQIYFMIPGQVHTWDFKTKPDGFIINFSERFLNELIANPRYLDQFTFFSGIVKDQVIDLPAKGHHQVVDVLEKIVNEFNSVQELKGDMMRTALIQLFILVSRCIDKEDSRQHPNYNSLIIRNFQKLIEKYYHEKRLTKDYATLLYITPNHLNALAKDVTGKSAGEMIRERVLLEAKRLLVNGDLSISEIATELDFIDNSYFTKFFKKYEGVTPDVFKKQLIKK